MSFLEPMLHHIRAAGLGTASEIFDGDPPFAPNGCVAQAWTVGETLRAWRTIASALGRQDKVPPVLNSEKFSSSRPTD
jgi:glycogen debranching enzyme